MNFKELWKLYLNERVEHRPEDLESPSWKKFLAESEEDDSPSEPETVYSPEESKPQSEQLSPAEIPAELFHATRPPLLSQIAEQGLRDHTDFSRHGAGQSGVSFTTEFDAVSSGQFGNLVLVFDGQELAASRQFIFSSHQDPTVDTDEAEVRVTMEDSAVDSGSGIDPKVDSLGTTIPFHFCRKMIFLYKLPKFELKWLKNNFPNVEIQSLP